MIVTYSWNYLLIQVDEVDEEKFELLALEWFCLFLCEIFCLVLKINSPLFLDIKLNRNEYPWRGAAKSSGIFARGKFKGKNLNFMMKVALKLDKPRSRISSYFHSSFARLI